jgi:hypothetical protein
MCLMFYLGIHFCLGFPYFLKKGQNQCTLVMGQEKTR